MLALAFICLGVLISGIAQIFFLIAAFRVSVLWGLGCLFLPFVNLVLLVTRWDEFKNPFYGNLAGIALIVVGVIAAPRDAQQQLMARGANAGYSRQAPMVHPDPTLAPQGESESEGEGEGEEAYATPPPRRGPIEKSFAPDEVPGPDVVAPCTVSSTPSGAEVFLNGKPTGRKTPVTVDVWGGFKTKVSVKLAGHRAPEAKIIDPDPKRAVSLDFTLAELAPVAVTTEPPGARVTYAGEVVVLRTPGTFEAPVGPLELLVQRDGSLDVIASIVAKAGETTSVSYTLKEAAYVKAESNPSGAQVWVDKKQTAQLTPAEVPVTPNTKHLITITGPGLTSVSKVLKVGAAGSHVTMSAELLDAELQKLRARAKAAERALERASAALETAQSKSDAADMRGYPDKKLQLRVTAAQEAVDRAQNASDEADAALDAYLTAHEGH